MPLKQILPNPDPLGRCGLGVCGGEKGTRPGTLRQRTGLKNQAPQGSLRPRSPKPKEAEKKLLYSIFLLFLFMRWEGPNNTRES